MRLACGRCIKLWALCRKRRFLLAYLRRSLQTMLDGLMDSATLSLLPYQQRLSRVAEGTGPATPQQPGATAKVLIPAQWGEIRSSIDRHSGR
jgi:hypothetical protein